MNIFVLSKFLNITDLNIEIVVSSVLWMDRGKTIKAATLIVLDRCTSPPPFSNLYTHLYAFVT